jgi:hypothetical protein
LASLLSLPNQESGEQLPAARSSGRGVISYHGVAAGPRWRCKHLPHIHSRLYFEQPGHGRRRHSEGTGMRASRGRRFFSAVSLSM